MLFNKKYDNSLWLILSGDKKNRELILDFVRSVPKKIYEELSRYLLDENTTENIYGLVKGKNHLIYMYRVNAKSRELYIGKCIRYNGNYSEIFIISLFPYNGLDKPIGMISYSLKSNMNENMVDCDEIEYSLVKTPFGIFLKKYCDYLPIVRTTFSTFDLIDEIDFDESIDSSILNKLVRRKKTGKVELR